MLTFGRNINEETGLKADGYLTFETGKIVYLTPSECKEVEDKFLLLLVRGKMDRQIKTGGLKFTCPSCDSHRLECCEDGPYSSEVLCIDEDGDFDYGPIDASGTVDRFQCLNCGYILSREDGSSIDDNEEVVEWIRENCKQDEPYIDPRYRDDNISQE